MKLGMFLGGVLLIASIGGLLLRRLASEAVPPDVGRPLTRSTSSSNGEACEPAPSERLAILDHAPGTSSEPRCKGTDALLDVLVVDATSREPLEGVRLMPARIDGAEPRVVEAVDSSEGSLENLPRTGVDGRARLQLAPGTAFRLDLLPRSALTESRSVDVAPLAEGARKSLVVELAKGYDLAFHGRVVARESGAPIPGAWAGAGEIGAELTGPDGRFVLLGPRWTKLRGGIAAEGYVSHPFDLAAGHETEEREQVFALERPARLTVIVLDSRREPCWGAEVVVVTPRYLESEETGADGRASFTSDLPPSVPLAIEIEWGMTKLEPEPVILAPGEHRVEEVVLESGATLSGSLRDAHDAPIGRRTIYLMQPGTSRAKVIPPAATMHARTLTDEDGRFVFTDVPPGEWLVGPARQPWTAGDKPVNEAILPIGEIVRVTGDADPSEVVVRAQRGLSIAGRVVGPDGRPAPGCNVRAQGEPGLHAGGSSDELGRFEVGPLAAGQHVLSASPGQAQRNLSRSGEVFARAGDTGVVLALASGGAIACEVRSTDGSTRDVEVRLFSGADCAEPRSEVARNVPGRCLFESLAPCSYSLVATSEHTTRIAVLRDVRLEAEERKEDLVLELAPAARLQVRCEGEEERGFISVRHEGLLVAEQWIEPGQEKYLVVPAGQLDVETRRSAESTAARTSMRLEPRDQREIVIR